MSCIMFMAVLWSHSVLLPIISTDLEAMSTEPNGTLSVRVPVQFSFSYVLQSLLDVVLYKVT